MDPCVFCDIVSGARPAIKVYEDDTSLAFFDAFPRARGHIQLIPKKHYRWIYDDPRMPELFAICKRIIHGIIPIVQCDHVVIASYGQQIAHAHIWILPQYKDQEEVKGEFTKNKKLNTEELVTLAQKIQTQLARGGV